MVPPPWQGRSGERGGLVPPHGSTKYKLSCPWQTTKKLIDYCKKKVCWLLGVELSEIVVATFEGPLCATQSKAPNVSHSSAGDPIAYNSQTTQTSGASILRRCRCSNTWEPKPKHETAMSTKDDMEAKRGRACLWKRSLKAGMWWTTVTLPMID